MTNTLFPRACAAIILMLLSAHAGTARAGAAASFQTLHSFSGGADGGTPTGGFAFDQAGNIYGVATRGGVFNASCPVGCGTLFKIDPATGAETTVHRFTYLKDGASPNGGLVTDAAGNIYGTTDIGGSQAGGTIYRFNPATLVLTTLYTFTGGADGANPNPLAFDNGGAVYGTTGGGGANRYGTAFRYDPTARKFTTLYAFAPARGDGYNSNGNLAFDGKGAFYGTAQSGGAHNAGTLFKLDPAAKTLTTLYAFTGGGDGRSPDGGLKFGIFGVLFGETTQGGADFQGTIFFLNPYSGQLVTVFTFPLGLDPSGPTGGITIGASGEILGEVGGRGGKIYEYDSQNRLTLLHEFTGADGSYPAGGLTMDITGNFYGATSHGATRRASCAVNSIVGPYGCGTVFRLTP